MKILRLFAGLAMIMVSTAHGQRSVINVCDLLRLSKHYDHKDIITSGFVYADIHSTGIEGEGCSGGIVLRYDVNSAPREFVKGVEEKRARLDTRRFRITIEGRFYARVPAPLGYIRRIEVTKVLDWAFVNEKARRPKPKPTTQ